MFLSASKVTVSPALTGCTVLPIFSPFAVAAEVAFQAAALIASTTFPTVAILSLSASTTVGTDEAVMLPVLTFKPLSSVVRVLSAAFTLTPSFVTSKDLSAGLTEIVFPVGSFCRPLPVLTLYLIVLVLPSVFVVTDTLVPSPSTKLTVS